MKRPIERRRCKGHLRDGSGKPCTKAPLRGAVVCASHGGGAPQVKRKAAERLADLIDPDRALREAARLAYSDPRELFDAQGKLRPIYEWPDELAAAIGGVEVLKRNVDSHDGRTDDVIKIKVWDKPQALTLLFKHLGLLKEQLEVSVKGDLVTRLVAGRRRVADAGHGKQA